MSLGGDQTFRLFHKASPEISRVPCSSRSSLRSFGPHDSTARLALFVPCYGHELLMVCSLKQRRGSSPNNSMGTAWGVNFSNPTQHPHLQGRPDRTPDLRAEPLSPAPLLVPTGPMALLQLSPGYQGLGYSSPCWPILAASAAPAPRGCPPGSQEGLCLLGSELLAQ